MEVPLIAHTPTNFNNLVTVIFKTKTYKGVECPSPLKNNNDKKWTLMCVIAADIGNFYINFDILSDHASNEDMFD